MNGIMKVPGVLMFALLGSEHIHADLITPQQAGQEFHRLMNAVHEGRVEDGITIGRALLPRLEEAFPGDNGLFPRGHVSYELGRLYIKRKDFPEALTLLRQASEIYGRINNHEALVPKARTELQIGYCYNVQSNYDHARQHLETALKMLNQDPKHRHSSTVGLVKMELAVPHEFTGDLQGADRLYREAIEIFQQQRGPTIHLSRAYNGLIRVLMKRPVAGGRNRLDDEIFSLCELSEQNLKRLRSSTSVEDMNTVSPSDLAAEFVQNRNTRGMAHWRRGEPGDLNKAHDEFTHAIQDAKQLKPYPVEKVAWLKVHLADVNKARGKLDVAEAHYVEALTSMEQSSVLQKTPETAAMRIRLAAYLVNQRRWAEVTKQLNLARQSLRTHVSETINTLTEPEQVAFLQVKDKLWFHASLSAVLQMQQQGERHQPLIDASAEWVLNGKGLMLPVMTERFIAARDAEGPRQETLQELLSVRRELSEQNFHVRVDESRIQQLEDKERDLNQQLARHMRQPNRPSDHWVTLDQVQNGLRRLKSAALVEIVRVDILDIEGGHPEWSRLDDQDRYVAWVIPANGPVRLVPLGLASQVDHAIQRFHETQLQQVKQKNRTVLFQGREAIRERLLAVSQLVWKPLRQSVQDVEWLVVSPDGNLWQFPWAAFSHENRYLIEQHTLQFVHSGRELVPRSAPALPNIVGPPLVVAGVNYGIMPDPKSIVSKIGFGDPVLRYSYAEGKESEKSLEAWTGQSVVFLSGEQATEETFLEQAQRPQVMLLSTHGFFRPVHESRFKHPLYRCGLAFAGAHRRGLDRRPADGLLFGVEILGMDLRGTEVVVLSACESAVGELAQAGDHASSLYSDAISEGLQSLQYAFRMAGAQSVIGTLWEVNDSDTAYLVKEFFKELSEGKAKAEALRTSQLKWIQELRQDEGGFAHPYYWAGLTISGN